MDAYTKFKGLDILYVEDDPGIRENVHEYLARLFRNVYPACDGEEGLLMYRRHKPHIILADIQMPRMNGLEMAKRIRQEDKDVQIIIATAHTDEKYLLEAVEMRLVRYVVKPVTRTNLLGALEKCLEELGERGVAGLVELGENHFFDRQKMELYLGDQPVALTKKECQLLQILLDARGGVVHYDVISAELWPEAPMTSDAIRTHAKNLRKKLPDGVIRTVSGVGYKIVLP